MLDISDGWWSFTHDWAQHKNKLVKFWYCQKAHIFLRCVQWTVLIFMRVMDIVTEWVKKLLHTLNFWYLRGGGYLFFLVFILWSLTWVTSCQVYRQLRAKRVLLQIIRCSVENQKGAIAIDFVLFCADCQCPSMSLLNSALLEITKISKCSRSLNNIFYQLTQV